MDDGRETVYPPQCQRTCNLGPAALKLVGGVLARNCRGPVRFGEDSVVLETGSGSQEAKLSPVDDEDRSTVSCRNPRLTNVTRKILDKEVNSALMS